MGSGQNLSGLVELGSMQCISGQVEPETSSKTLNVVGKMSQNFNIFGCFKPNDTLFEK